jgi:2-dehydropantoate 2-reductase
MRIVIIGPGALGCLFAASIASTITTASGRRDTLWLLDHNADRAGIIAERGLILERDGQRLVYPIRATANPIDIGGADIVLFCVKSNDVADALERASPFIDPESLLIFLQNGIAHLNLLEKVETLGRIAVGVTAQGATLLDAGRVRHAGRGLTRIGFLKIPPHSGQAKLAAAAALLTSAGIQVEIVTDIIERVWAKLFINVGINALTAIFNCQNGALLDLPPARAQLAEAVREAVAVAKAMGIPIREEPLATTLEVCRATAENISSMLQDVRRQRPTEIDAINGAVVDLGKKLGISTRTNEQLVLKVKEMEHNYLL